ncbi:MAG: hypothetical protein Q8R83_01880 [Legionellaceae bacterium]|nr:hypothetical protein [Legionellaceae bacterium]
MGDCKNEQILRSLSNSTSHESSLSASASLGSSISALTDPTELSAHSYDSALSFIGLNLQLPIDDSETNQIERHCPAAPPPSPSGPNKPVLKRQSSYGSSTSSSPEITLRKSLNPSDNLSSLRCGSESPTKKVQFSSSTKVPEDIIIPKLRQYTKRKCPTSSSFIMNILSNPYTGSLAISGVILLIAGVVALGLAFGCPQAIAIILGTSAGSLVTLQVVSCFSIGYGLAIGAGFLFFRDQPSKPSNRSNALIHRSSSPAQLNGHDADNNPNYDQTIIAMNPVV